MYERNNTIFVACILAMAFFAVFVEIIIRIINM